MNKQKFIKIFFPLAFLVIILLIGWQVFQYIQEQRQIVRRGDEQVSEEKRTELEKKIHDASEKIQKNVKDFQGYLERALAEEELGEWEKAVATYEEMNKEFPNNFISYSNLGKLYERMKDYRNAEKMYKRAIAVANTKPDLLFPLIELYRFHLTEKQGTIPSVINESLQWNPNNIGLFASLATYYDELAHESRKAIATWEKLLTIDPKHTIANRELERLRNQ